MSKPGAQLTREMRRKEKELDEMRKLGNAPAAQDEDGKDINPHIPQYITKLPFFYENLGPTLKHQRIPEDQVKHYTTIAEDYHKRGQKKGPTATRYRKGACGNCGAMTHKTIECLERPRRIGAQFNGKNIAPDEYLPAPGNHTYDGKRDIHKHYDPNDYQKVIQDYEKVEQMKRQLKNEQLQKDLIEQSKKTAEEKAAERVAPAAEESSDSEEEGEDDKKKKAEDELKGYTESSSMAGTKFDTKNRQTIRNLRIREDTAKYLLNLDANSAHYDAKTRSLRANPFEGKEEERIRRNITYVGDNFERYGGDSIAMAQKNVFAWAAAEKGADVHMQADPTKLELMHKTYAEKRDKFEESQREGILSKYGGQEHLEAPPKELLLAQTEHYVEYSQAGKVIKGQEKAKVVSRFEEDVYPGNHTSVWGSYWKSGRWGFACCHSLEIISYCSGAAGREANEASSNMMMLEQATEAAEEAAEFKAPKSMVDMHREQGKKERKEKRDKKKQGEQEDEEDRKARERHEKIAAFMKKHQEQDKQADEELNKNERDRSYNSLKRDHAEVTEEEMEAYKMGKRNKDDPMAQFL